MRAQGGLERRLGCAASIVLLTVGSAWGQTYPARTVRMVLPFPAGGGTDFIGRAVAQKLSELWGQSVVIDNRPGGTTVIGADLVAKSPADGYTLLVTPVPFSIVPSLMAKLPYDPLKDFEPIALYNTAPLVFVVNPVVPARTPKELIALAKARPGVLNFGTSGAGSSNHLAGELFNAMAGVKIVHIPYKGSPPRAYRPGGRSRRSCGHHPDLGSRAHQIEQGARARRHQPQAIGVHA